MYAPPLQRHASLDTIAGAGVAATDGGANGNWTLATASTETGFLADGGVTSIPAGASGKMQVMDDGDLEWTDEAASPGQQSVDSRAASIHASASTITSGSLSRPLDLTRNELIAFTDSQGGASTARFRMGHYRGETGQWNPRGEENEKWKACWNCGSAALESRGDTRTLGLRRVREHLEPVAGESGKMHRIEPGMRAGLGVERELPERLGYGSRRGRAVALL